MARKKRKFERNITEQDKYMNNLKFKDLKRECVIRGMDFDDVIKADVSKLHRWLHDNFFESMNHDLLNDFDDHQEKMIREALKDKDADPEDIIHPSLRLGYIAERDDDGNVIKRKRVRTLIKKKKPKRERTSDGIFAGTKKAFTFELQQQGLSKEETITKVMEQFPDASAKSIGIWFNKSKKIRK